MALQKSINCQRVDLTNLLIQYTMDRCDSDVNKSVVFINNRFSIRFCEYGFIMKVLY